jgi:DNA helicase HerA-like ATPase
MNIISVGKTVRILGALPQGVYTTPSSVLYVYGYECNVIEEAYALGAEMGRFSRCVSKAVPLQGVPKLGEEVKPVDEKCGEVGCGYRPVGADLLFSGRHVAVVGGTGAGKTTLLLRALEHTEKNAVVLAYHPDLLELKKAGYRVVKPQLNICDLDEEVIKMVIGFHRLQNEPVKMSRYLHMLLPIACKHYREFNKPPHEMLKLLIEAVTLLEFLESRCKVAQLGAEQESETVLCRLKEVLRQELGQFRYNIVRELSKERDAQSLQSLYFYLSYAVAKNSDMFGEDAVYEGRVVVDITESLALITAGIEPAVAAVLSHIFDSGVRGYKEGRVRELYVVIDEGAALVANQYIRQIITLLLQQGRKFGRFLIFATQPIKDVYDLLSNFHTIILGRVAGSMAIKELAKSLPNVPTPLLASLPSMPPLHMTAVSPNGILPFRVLQPSWRT